MIWKSFDLLTTDQIDSDHGKISLASLTLSFRQDRWTVEHGSIFIRERVEDRSSIFPLFFFPLTSYRRIILFVLDLSRISLIVYTVEKRSLTLRRLSLIIIIIRADIHLTFAVGTVTGTNNQQPTIQIMPFRTFISAPNCGLWILYRIQNRAWQEHLERFWYYLIIIKLLSETFNIIGIELFSVHLFYLRSTHSVLF